ncbi:MAG: SDR family oxidoreductase [Candidatus Kariarchaeaceae archaeon]
MCTATIRRWDLLQRPPDEIADLITFLGSTKSSWITGETISIDGGRFLTCFRKIIL